MFENRFFSLRSLSKAILASFILIMIFSASIFALLLFWGFYSPYKECLSRTDYERPLPNLIKNGREADLKVFFNEEKPIVLSLPDLKHSLPAVSYFPFPDRKDVKKEYRIGDEIVESGKKIYLKQENAHFQISSSPTDLAIVPRQLGPRICCDVLASLPDRYQLDVSEYTFPVNEVVHKENLPSAFALLQKGKWLGKDLASSSKQRLQVEDKIFYLDTNDRLIFKEGIWQKAIEDQDISNYPVAMFGSEETTLILYGWEPAVCGHFEWGYSLETSDFATDSSSFIQEPAMRSCGLVSCKMGGKRTLLQADRWYIHRLNQWRLLSQVLPFEELADGRSDDLFYCEAIIEEEGSSFIKGYLFNSCRNEKKEVIVPLPPKKNHLRHQAIMQRINKNSE